MIWRRIKWVLVYSIAIILPQIPNGTFASGASRSSVGFVEMPESPKNEWILNSPIGSEKAWGRVETIRHLQLVCREWHRRYPNRPKVRVGDISKPNGGSFPPHNTHNVGLSVDIKTRPDNIVDTKFTHQEQAIQLAEIFYTFGACRILYGQSYMFDGLSIVTPFEGHNTHFHVDVNPASVPLAGEWVVIPKVDLVNPETLPTSEGKVQLLFSCDILGVIAEDSHTWKTVLPSERDNISIQLQDIDNSKGTLSIYRCPISESKAIKHILPLPADRKYKLRIQFVTASNDEFTSGWFILETSHGSESKPRLACITTNEIPNIPIHFTVLTRNPRASRRTTREYLAREIDRLNDQYARDNTQNKVVFSLKSISDVQIVRRSGSRLVRLIDTRHGYNRESWRHLVNFCFDFRVVNPSAINVFIYDAYSKTSGFSSKSTWLQRNSGRPYIFLDWERTLNSDMVSAIVQDPNNFAQFVAGNPRLLRKSRTLDY